MRTLVILAALAILPLTGCLGSGDGTAAAPDDGTAGSRDASHFVLGEPSTVAPTPNNQAEAAVSVSADGQTVLTCFHGLFTQTSPGYASTDGGERWARMAFPDHAGPGGDCETAITPSGAWVFLASTVAGATILVTQDQGATWTVNPVTAIPINGLADRPWVEAVGEELWLAYMPLFAQPGTIGFTKSTDLGETWTVPQFIGEPGTDEVSVRHGHFAIGDDAVYLPMVRYRSSFAEGDRVVQLASTSDNGASWSVEAIYRGPEIVDDWPSLAVTEHGDLLFVVSAPVGGQVGPHVLHLEPGGEWTAPVPIHEPENEGAFWPWIAGGHGRNATFIVDGGEHEGDSYLWIGRIDAADMSVETWPVDDGAVVEFASVDHDAEGNAYAVWISSAEQLFVKGTVR